MSQKTWTMRTSRRGSSCDGVKKGNSFSSKMKKIFFNQCEPTDRLPRPASATTTKSESIKSKIRKMGPVSKARNRAAANFSGSSVEEEIDFDKQLGKERRFDDRECMWLSSDTSSPSNFFEEHRLHLSVDEWLVSWLSTLANSYLHLDKAIALFDESGKNPEDDCSGSDRTAQDSGFVLLEDLKEEKRLSLLSKSSRNYAADSSVVGSDSSRPSFGLYRQNFTSCDHSSITSSAVSNSPSCSSQISDLDRLNFSVSLVNLDDENSKWISGAEFEFDRLQSGFPSPFCRTSWSAEVLSSGSNDSTPSKLKEEHSQYDMTSDSAYSEAKNLEDFNADEPLFWPSDRKLDWNAEETWNCFIMSPRKDIVKLGGHQGASSKSVGAKFHGKKMDSKVGSRRRFVFSSDSVASKILGLKQRNDSIPSKNIRFMPSRLRKSTSNPTKTLPSETDDDVKQAKDGKVPGSKLNLDDRNMLEDDFGSNAEVPIETLLGLVEFDGHEGVDSEFNEDVFQLDDCI